jgi:hypothetical protein
MYNKRRKEYVQAISGEQTDIIKYKKDYLRRISAATIANKIMGDPVLVKRYKIPWASGPEGRKWRIDHASIASGEKCGNKTAYNAKQIIESRLIRRRR